MSYTEFCKKLSNIKEPAGGWQKRGIFSRSRKQNASKKDIVESCVDLIPKDLIPLQDNKVSGIDFFCGHGFTTKWTKKRYPHYNVMGVDIFKFADWDESEGVDFFQCDVMDVLKIENPPKFDFVITMNTLRSNSWDSDKYFLPWCKENTKYIITNTGNNIKGFTLKKRGEQGINLYEVS